MKVWVAVWLAAFACDRGESVTAKGAAKETTASASPDSAAPSAESRTAVEFYPSSELARVASQATGGRTFGSQHSSFHYVEARRAASGSPEIHDNWIDVTVVQAGRATLLSGGSVSGGSVTEAGEHRGGTITGGTTHPIAAGDMFVVPAGTPHQFQLGQGDTIRYLTIKIAK